MVNFWTLGIAGKDGGLVDAVTDHRPAAAPRCHSTKQGGHHPVVGLGNSCLVFAQLVVVDVVNHDVIGSSPSLFESARRLTTPECNKGRPVGDAKPPALPLGAFVSLNPKISAVCLIVRELRL